MRLFVFDGTLEDVVEVAKLLSTSPAGMTTQPLLATSPPKTARAPTVCGHDASCRLEPGGHRTEYYRLDASCGWRALRCRPWAFRKQRDPWRPAKVKNLLWEQPKLCDESHAINSANAGHSVNDESEVEKMLDIANAKADTDGDIEEAICGKKMTDIASANVTDGVKKANCGEEGVYIANAKADIEGSMKDESCGELMTDIPNAKVDTSSGAKGVSHGEKVTDIANAKADSKKAMKRAKHRGKVTSTANAEDVPACGAKGVNFSEEKIDIDNAKIYHSEDMTTAASNESLNDFIEALMRCDGQRWLSAVSNASNCEGDKNFEYLFDLLSYASRNHFKVDQPNIENSQQCERFFKGAREEMESRYDTIVYALIKNDPMSAKTWHRMRVRALRNVHEFLNKMEAEVATRVRVLTPKVLKPPKEKPWKMKGVSSR
eukprot:TRINITY_DN46157_c0_g1_i9.p1 TRINITY_DN46157_c0_g1~~TRINITY_DN46157_c0_g1_i9.p1  ORF type:complete len:432 (-),score=102.88 TRINITY_DN46157_c0_g1_i9:92-1387(-)